MLSALLRLVHTCWTLVALCLSKLWGRLLHFRTDATEISEPEAGSLGPDAQGFPAATDDQRNQARRAFVESLDPDAVCALASGYNGGRPCKVVRHDSGSFNVCFFVEFDEDAPGWIVRVPIEPALDDPWDKLMSEVTTIQYLKSNTRIPVPQIRAYGRDAKLIKAARGTQMFLIADLIPGEPLDKRLLIAAKEEYRRNFYSQLIDILAELRKLEFPSIGSLMPNPNGGDVHPVLGPSSPCLPLVIDPRPDKGPFVLNHLDLRSPNIIVDKDLQIQGIIDWEFTSTVPRQVFTPPSWITGHDSIETDKHTHAEFRRVLDEKSKTDAFCDQLRREWYGRPDDAGKSDTEFCVAHVQRPTDAADIFCDFFAPKLSDKHLDDMLSEFFSQHQDLALEVQRRAEHCERYTQYLKDNGLHETEADKLLAASKALKAKWGWS
ncbi:hypothetical protein ACJ41O_010565 [Fusarium nematophilum]